MIKIDGELGMHPAMAPMKQVYDSGALAIIHGIGYENSVRSHFRSMDIWHTCEPDLVGTEGWLGRALRDIDPAGENPVTGVNIGESLPRALAAPGVSVASVGDVSNYGLLTSVEEQDQRSEMLQRFANMYAPAVGTGRVMEYLGQTGLNALKGVDILKAAPAQYSSSVEYGSSGIAKSLRDVAMIHQANLGTRIFYTQHGLFSTHTRTKHRPTPNSGVRCQRPLPTSGTIFGSTTPTTTSLCSCSPSSVAAPVITVRAQTTGRGRVLPDWTQGQGRNVRRVP